MLRRIMGLGLAVVSLCFGAESRPPFQVDFQQLGYLTAPRSRLAQHDKIDGLTFRSGAFWVQIHTQSGVRTAKISATDYRVIEVGPLLPSQPATLNAPEQELARQQFDEAYAREQQRNHPTILGNERLHGDADGDLFIDSPKGSQLIYKVQPNCRENREIIGRSLSGYYFFLDSNRICVWDCNKFKVISTSGQLRYTLPLSYISARITRGKSLFATLEPARTLLGHLIPAPEDSSRLQVFCFSTGKRLVNDSWPAANWDSLVLSDDDHTVAVHDESTVRFYRLESECCPK